MSILPFTEARHTVERQVRELKPVAAEALPLLQARGRVLAESVLADRDFPPFPRAIRDGYAVRAADLTTVPVRLEVVGEIRAGVAPEMVVCGIKSGEAAEIMTGAPLPPGADAVVMVEYTSRQGEIVTISRGASAGENFVPRGAEARIGDELLAPGTRVDHAAIAVAAGVGKSELRVHAKPQVAILSTGDELVEISAVPGPYQIRNSNSYSLAAQVSAAGGRALVLPIARDDSDDLHRSIERGLAADLLLVTGGVSMGKFDLVEQTLEHFEAEFFFTGALIQPGRPVVFGRCARAFSTHARGPSDGHDPGSSQLATRNSVLFFGLPGNPASTMVTFELFVRPVIDALTGATPKPLVFLKARLKSELRTRTGLTRFLPATLGGEFDCPEVELVHWQGSGDIAAMARANCYVVVPPDQECIATGEMASVLLKNQWNG